jgi:hypothetical protein
MSSPINNKKRSHPDECKATNYKLSKECEEELREEFKKWNEETELYCAVGSQWFDETIAKRDDDENQPSPLNGIRESMPFNLVMEELLYLFNEKPHLLFRSKCSPCSKSFRLTKSCSRLYPKDKYGFHDVCEDCRVRKRCEHFEMNLDSLPNVNGYEHKHMLRCGNELPLHSFHNSCSQCRYYAFSRSQMRKVDDKKYRQHKGDEKAVRWERFSTCCCNDLKWAAIHELDDTPAKIPYRLKCYHCKKDIETVLDEEEEYRSHYIRRWVFASKLPRLKDLFNKV